MENFVVTNLKQFSVFQHFKTDKNFLSGSHEIRIKGKRLHFKNSKYQNTNEHGLEIKSDAYLNHEFVIGQCREKVEGASFTGINTKMGDLLTVKLWNQAPDPADMPNKIFVFMVGDAILNISDTGIQFVD